MALPLIAIFIRRELMKQYVKNVWLPRERRNAAAALANAIRKNLRIEAKVHGIPELKKALSEVPRKLRNQIMTKALREGATVIRDAARARAPILKTPAKNRKPGTIKRNIIVRASKFARRNGNVGVYVSVRPLRGARQKKFGRAGADNPNDPFYWIFQEFGTRPHEIKAPFKKALRVGSGFAKSVKHPGQKAAPFLKPAGAKLPQVAQQIINSAARQINALNR